MKKSIKVTLSEKIYQKLRNDIITQKIPCGKKLTLQSLKTQFDVSHTPVRDALTRLNEEGLISYYSNCGINVVTFTEQDIHNLFNFVSELDSISVKFCKYLISQSSLLFELDELMSLSEAHIKNDNVVEWQHCSEDFHLIFYKYANNNYLDEAAKKVRAKIALLSNLYNSTENIIKIHNEHKVICDYIKSNDYDKASNMMLKHSQDGVIYALKAYKQITIND